jgi:hypothetical protein
MIADIKEIHELFHPDKLDELKSICIKADRLGDRISADEIFKLYFYLNKACALAASLFCCLKDSVSRIENFDTKDFTLSPNPKSEIRFHKSFPKKIL